MAGFESIWDEPEPEETRWLRRSVPDYPNPAPEITAQAYATLRAQRAERQAALEVDDSEYEIVITHEAEEFDDPIRSLAGVVKLAHANGWRIHTLAHAYAFAKGKPFKGGANEGQPRPDQEIETQWLYAEKPGVGRLSVAYEIVNGVVRNTNTTRRFNGNRYGDRELKAIIRGEQ